MKKLFQLVAFSLILSSVSLEAATEKTDKIAAADVLLEQNRRIESNYQFTFHGKTFVGYPNVYSPIIFPGANKQTDIPIRTGDHFLEIGCGTGIFSVLAALEEAEIVFAIDINPDAVANTIENAHLHGVADKMQVLQGDMFDPLEETQLFDVIFFNIPFCHRDCKIDELTMLGQSLYDPEHELLHRYFKEGKIHLKEGGKLILGYSTTHGNIELMYELAKKYNWQVTLLNKVGDEVTDFITIELYEFRQ
ncbi:MAG: methyltransferase domain-containing protein [Parachlamydiaceae bacterium]|nr:methyltransferase domain-containing protein [Parachlamydiaceae bacterium]